MTLSKSQEEWLAHISNEDHIKIVPYDKTAESKFRKIRNLIHNKIGKDIRVEHHGATSLKISGQDEIDIYVPVPPDRFDRMVSILAQIFGEPRSNYPLNRARFVTQLGLKHIDIHLVNREHKNWLDGLRFEKYLRSHPKMLIKYQILKEEGSGMTVRDYYRRKIEFINYILSLDLS